MHTINCVCIPSLLRKAFEKMFFWENFSLGFGNSCNGMISAEVFKVFLNPSEDNIDKFLSSLTSELYDALDKV
jgi:hypothetical protein